MPTWRWLMAGTFTTSAAGRKLGVSGQRFTAVMQTMGVHASGLLPESLGDAVRQPAALEFARPRRFRVTEVIAAIEPLRRLDRLAATLEKMPDRTPEQIAIAVREIVGARGLADRLTPAGDSPEAETAPKATPAVQTETETETPTKTKTPSPADGAVDDIFAKVQLPGAGESASSTAKSGLDAFVGAIRGPSIQRTTRHQEAGIAAARTIRAAIAEAAISVLGQPSTARLEASWRGLKMLVSASPGHDTLAIELLDVEPDTIVGALERAVHTDDPMCPNAIFVGIVLSPTTLQAVAEFAERVQVPVVVGVSETLTGPAWCEEEPRVAPDWTTLRERSCANWLCAAANPVVLANEDTAAGPRVVLGSAAWGVAAILANSLGRRGGLGGAVGPSASVVAPAAHEVDIGFSEPRIVPTREYANVDALRRAADHGIVLLGSAPGSDQFLIASATMAGRGGLVSRMQTAARSG